VTRTSTITTPTVLLSVLFLVGPALAADLPARMPAKAPLAAPAPYLNWTGCYLGAHVGGAWSNTDFDDAFDTPIASASSSSVLGGGQIGCNYQISPNWLVGVEGEISGTDLKGSAAAPVFPPATLTDSLSAKSDWIASVTARIGYTSGPWQLYAKGGAAWARYDYHDSGTFGLVPIGFPFTFDFAGRDTPAGWTVGVGGEWAFTQNWSVSLEYDHYDFGRRTVTLVDPILAATPGAAGGGVEVLSIKNQIETVKLGVNYRF